MIFVPVETHPQSQWKRTLHEINLLFDIVIFSKDFLKRERPVQDLIPTTTLPSSTPNPSAKLTTSKLE